MRRTPGPDIIARVEFLTTEAGGRKGPTPPDELRCPMILNGRAFDCVLLLNDVGSLAPGQTATVPMEFVSPELVKSKLKPGTRFDLFERGKTADGQVLETRFPATGPVELSVAEVTFILETLNLDRDQRAELEAARNRHAAKLQPDLADDLRDLCADMLATRGFDRDYEPTALGRKLEALIDKLFTG